MDKAKVELLAKLELFTKLNSVELAELAEYFEWKTYSSGTYIIRQGQDYDSFYILAEGTVKVYYTKSGEESLEVESFGPGDVFGEISLFIGKPAWATIYCSSDCRLLVLNSQHFSEMLDHWPKLYESFIIKMSRRLDQLNSGLFEAKHKDSLRSGLRLNQFKAKFYDIWGGTKTTKEVEARLKELAQNHKHLLLIGERGTGQQMMAWHLHRLQYGEAAPFIVMTGRQLDQLWAEMSNLKGTSLLDIAEGGTLFIRDINLLSPTSQLKLAVALYSEKANCRIIGTLLADPEALSVKLLPQLANFFGETYHFTPLRERKKDIPVLAEGILEKLALQHSRKTPHLDQEATKILLTHDYRQGNVTELIKIVERAFFLAKGDLIGSRHLFFGPTVKIGRSVDLLAWKNISSLVKKELFPLWVQGINTVFFLILVVVLFIMPSSTVSETGLILAWGLWWPSLAIIAFTLGRIWCSICPFSFIMEQVQKLIHLDLPVPNLLKKYDYVFTTVLFVFIMWLEAVTQMRFNSYFTGFLLVSIILAATVTGIIFTRHTWCRHLCPLGGFIGTASIGGMLEVRADSEICLNKCTTHECYRGTDKSPGCPMSQHAAFLESNYACKLCLRCINNCPNDAVKLNVRMPAREIWHLLRVNQGFSIFVGVALAILLPLTLFESLREVWSPERWHFWFTLVLWGTALITAGLIWLLAKPFQTKAASKRIKLVFALIPILVTGYIAYQLHFIPGAGNLLISYEAQGLGKAVSIPLYRIGQGIILSLGLTLTIITTIMVWRRSTKAKIHD